MPLSMFFAWLLFVFVVKVSSDEFVYVDTNAEDIVDENLLQFPLPVAVLNIRTSNAYLAGSADQIQVTLKGDFAVSGPHSIGPFAAGDVSTVTITLSRVIGNLNSVLLYKSGIDSYLLAHMNCLIGNKVYEMTGPRQWLDNLDPATATSYPSSKGFEPMAQEDVDMLPVAPTLELTVKNTQYHYTSAGLAKE